MDNLKTAIICIAKMENAYIRDFVEYHRRLGFTHIFIYDNNDVDGEKFTDVIDDYIREGYVTILNIRGAAIIFVKNMIGCLQLILMNFSHSQIKT